MRSLPGSRGGARADDARESSPVGGTSGTTMSAAVSRALDVVIAGVVLAVAGPAVAVIALAIRSTMGSPVLFRQQRAGHGGRTFELVKFRTMRNAEPGDDGPATDAARLTRLGSLLRATSLDELPTLVNVLRGDMSLVGPRPLPVRYLARYSPVHGRRHEVRPGITGWAQVNGRNTVTWDDQLDMDIWYVDNMSVRLDLRIMASTVTSVLHRDGISHEGHATRPEFPGSGVDLPQPAR